MRRCRATNGAMNSNRGRYSSDRKAIQQDQKTGSWCNFDGIWLKICGLRSSKIFYLRTLRQRSMITIAVTGGIGAGKSETIDILRKLGASTVSADHLGHTAYARGTPGYADMVKAFGNKIIGEDGQIDRQSVGSIVFNDEAKRKILESIVWHRIREMLEGVINQNRDNHTDVTAIEAAVLFEAGWEDLADRVWTVESSYHQRLARIVEKTGMDERRDTQAHGCATRTRDQDRTSRRNHI